MTGPLPPPSSEEDFTERLGRELVSLSHKWRRALSRRITALEVSDAQWSLLDSLRRTGDGENQQVIATRLGLERSAVVRVMNDMETMGLIRRKASIRDGRQKLVFLTPKGEALAQRIYDVIRSVEDPLFADLPRDQLETFRNLITQLHERVDALYAKPEDPTHWDD